MATLMNASLLSTVRSYSFDSRRDRPSHPNVRSTIHRFGWTTNPTCPRSLRTTIPTHPHRIQPCVRAVSKCESPHTTFSRLTAPRSRSTSGMPPTRSWMSAGVTINAQISPSVSTATNRLRPATFFPPVVPVRGTELGPLDRLTVHDRDRRLGVLPDRLPNLLPEGVVNLVPGAVRLPRAEVVEHDPVRGQVMRQRSPHAPVPGLVQDRVDHLPAGVPGRPTTRLRPRDVALDQLPLAIRQVGRIGCAAHAENL